MNNTKTALQEIEEILEHTATLSKDEETLRRLASELDQARKSLGHNQTRVLY